MARPRGSLMRRLSSPKVMFVLGIVDLALGVVYAAQPSQRGSGIFLIVAGVMLLGAAFLIRRGERKRARRAIEKATAKRPSHRPPPKKAVRPSSGPKAGSRHRLAGPAREKPVEVESRGLADRLFGERKKAE